MPPRAFDECWRDADLVAYFEATCSLYVAWLEAMARRLEARRTELRRPRFPYASFHAHQRRIAKHVYRGLRDDAHRLVEAPTGAGKTMACLFPALKAMGEGALDRGRCVREDVEEVARRFEVCPFATATRSRIGSQRWHGSRKRLAESPAATTQAWPCWWTRVSQVRPTALLPSPLAPANPSRQGRRGRGGSILVVRAHSAAGDLVSRFFAVILNPERIYRTLRMPLELRSHVRLW